MAVLDVLEFPNPKLRRKAQSVEAVTPKITKLSEDMLETMYAANGIGLAAVQVNVPLRVIVLDVSEKRDEPMILINPEFERQGENDITSTEGCLSVPGIFENVKRYEQIRVRALGSGGKENQFEAHGRLAVCIQHEVDHLEGRLFVDYLSSLKQSRIRKILSKFRATA